MIVRVPDYFSEFSCIAGDCKDSCCLGWEIDIDEDSYEYYQTLPGEVGERLRKGIDFDVKYVNNVTPGQASVVITGKNRYCGTKVVNFYIVPKKVSVKVKNYKYNYAGEVYWSPVAYADGYEVQVSTDSGFNKYLRTYDVKDGSVSKAVLFYLNHNKDYYVRVRAYVNTPDGNKYGNWSDKTRQRRKGCKCYCWKCGK